MIKIIITEDNLISQKALIEKLDDYNDLSLVKVCNNGQEAVDFLAQNQTVDLILMDIEMPILNGIEATKILKSQYPNLKIVMITIYDDDENIFNAIKSGADSYLLKDASSDKIYETIRETLSGGAVMSPSIALKTLKLLRNPL